MNNQAHRDVVAKLAKAHDAKYSKQAHAALVSEAKKAYQDFKRRADELGGDMNNNGEYKSAWGDVRKALRGE
jgi:hypothetical protein